MLPRRLAPRVLRLVRTFAVPYALASLRPAEVLPVPSPPGPALPPKQSEFEGLDHVNVVEIPTSAPDDIVLNLIEDAPVRRPQPTQPGIPAEEGPPEPEKGLRPGGSLAEAGARLQIDLGGPLSRVTLRASRGWTRLTCGTPFSGKMCRQVVPPTAD